jgi:outer membrane protein
MKTAIKLTVIAATLLCSNLSAQTTKMAYISMQELITTMPEYDSAMVKMQKFIKDLEVEIEAMTVERNKQVAEYTEKQATWTELVRQSRGEAINAMQQKIQTFQEQAQESIQVEQAKLMQPVQERAAKAIETVAKEQGITHVLDAQVLHFKAVGTLDLLPAVKQHLGIKK